jgi:MFS family permease
MIDFGRDTLRFIRANARWIGGGFLLTMFSSFGQTFFIGMSGKALRETFHLSAGGFGGLYMLATLASALTLPWLGRTLDLMPGWKVVRFTMPALALACVLLVLAPNLLWLTGALYLLRLFGQGMMTETAYTEIGRWFVANRGRAMALILPGQQAGFALLPIFVVVLDRVGGSWRAAWIASAGLIVLVGLPSILVLTRVGRVPHSQEVKASALRTARSWTRAEVLRDPVFYLLQVGALAPPFVATVIFFNQDYLIALRGYDPLIFAAAFPVMSLSTVVFGLAGGHLIDRFGAVPLLPYFLVPLAVTAAVLGLIAPVWGVYLSMFLFGISNGLTSTMLGALWPEVYGLANLGGIRAMIVSAMVLASAIGPGLSGLLIDRGVALPRQLLWLSGWCVFACFVLAYAARRIRRREAGAPAPRAA